MFATLWNGKYLERINKKLRKNVPLSEHFICTINHCSFTNYCRFTNYRNHLQQLYYSPSLPLHYANE